MNTAVHYYQPCPVCSRALRIRVSLLGKHVYCQHCGGGFRATDPATRQSTGGHAAAARTALAGAEDRPAAFAPGADDLLERVEVVLRRAAEARAAVEIPVRQAVGPNACAERSGQPAVSSLASPASTRQ